MKLAEIIPFVRYVHFLDIDKKRQFGKSTPFDHRLFYLLSGNGKIAIGERTLTLCEGDAVIIPSGTTYELLPTEKTVRYIGVNFDYTQENSEKAIPVSPVFSGKFEPQMRFEAIDFTDVQELNTTLFLKGINSISSKLLKMNREYGSKLLGFYNVTSGILAGIIVECVRRNRAVKFGKNEKTVTDIIEYVDKNFSSALTAEAVAAVFGLHPNYLSFLIKSYTGMPLHRYLMHVRVSRATSMLSSGEYTVGEVAQRCGFVDIYHFSKVFKRIAGVPPSKYSYIM